MRRNLLRCYLRDFRTLPAFLWAVYIFNWREFILCQHLCLKDLLWIVKMLDEWYVTWGCFCVLQDFGNQAFCGAKESCLFVFRFVLALFWKMENCNSAFKLINFQFLLHIYHLEMWKLHVELFISSSINLLNTIKVSKFKLEFFYHGLNQCGKLRYCGHRHHFPRFYLGLEWPRKCYQLAVEC